MAKKKAPVINGATVLKIRNNLGQTQGEFWSRVGVAQSAGSRYESGRNISRPIRKLVYLCYMGGNLVDDEFDLI